MSRTTVTLEVESESQARLLRRYHAWLHELRELAHSAPEGHILEVLEEAVVTQGRERLRQTLEEAVQQRIDAAEKKGRRCGVVGAAAGAAIAVVALGK